MNILQSGMITLFKSAITGQTYALPEGFSIEEAYALSKRHHITNLLYLGACNCGISRDEKAMQEMFSSYCVSTIRSEVQLQTLHRVLDAFEAAQIEYLPLKGSKIKALYPKPELRYMGDADVLIRMEQYPQIAPIMESLGFTHQKTTDHEIVWSSKALLMELHQRIVPSYNKDFYAYFGDGWQRARKIAGMQYDLSTEDEMIFLFTHFAKHYRDGGIGCRYVVDLWLFRNAHPEMDGDYLCQELKKLWLWEFYENIMHLMDVWFCEKPTDPKTDFLTEFIFSSGSWGVHSKRLLSTALKKAPRTTGKGAKLTYAWSILFPAKGYLYKQYPVLKQKPWLLPAIWVIRPFRKVLFQRDALKKQKENLDALKDEELQLHKQMLNYVGLDYHF